MEVNAMVLNIKEVLKRLKRDIEEHGIDKVAQKQGIEKDLLERFYRGEELSDFELIYFYEMYDDDVLYDDDYRETGDFDFERTIFGDEIARKLEQEMRRSSGAEDDIDDDDDVEESYDFVTDKDDSYDSEEMGPEDYIELQEYEKLEESEYGWVVEAEEYEESFGTEEEIERWDDKIDDMEDWENL